MDVWPLRPNWRDPVRITHTYQTEVISSRARKEQRRSNRQTAHKTVEFGVTVHRDRFRSLTRMFDTHLGPVIAWADPTRAIRVFGPVSAGSYSVAVTAPPEWAVAGFKVCLVYRDHSTLLTVQSVSSGAVTFVEALEAWNEVKLCPAVLGRLPTETGMQQFLPGVIETTVKIDQDPGSEIARYAGEPAVIWNGREVFLGNGDWGNPRDLNVIRDYELVDYGFGRVSAFTPGSFAWTVRAVEYHAKTKYEADDLLKFFERCKGQRGEFYVPSDQPDIELVTSGGGNQFDAAGLDLRGAYATDPVHKSICVKMKDGQRAYAKIASLTVAGDNTRFNLTANLPFSISPDTVEVISWMPVTRFATDEVVFEWLTDEVAQVRFTFKSLPDAPAE